MQDRGFEIVEGVLTTAECDALLSDLGPSRRTRAGARHLMAHPSIRSLAGRPDLLSLARRGTGSGAIPYRATLFEKSGVRNWLVVWHQDTTLPLASRFKDPGWGPWSEKEGVIYAHAPAWALERIIALRIHLDASTLENGPLRVIPGSHRAGLLADEEVFRVSRKQNSLECEVGRGGVLAMRPLIIHASSKARSAEPRRVLHLEYAPSLELAPGIRIVVA